MNFAMNFMKKILYSLILFLFFSAKGLLAADSSDILIHAVGGWNQDLQVFQGRGNVAYAFWNDFSLGPVMEFNEFFKAPGLGLTWHLEPFELLVHGGPLFWSKEGEKKTSVHVSIHASYLLQFTTHFAGLLTAGVNLPEKYFRGVPLGAGLRYWF